MAKEISLRNKLVFASALAFAIALLALQMGSIGIHRAMAIDLPFPAGIPEITVNLCSDGLDNDNDGDVDLDDADCSSYIPILRVKKVLVGGSAKISDFTLFVNGDEVKSGEENLFDPGEYTVTESGPDGYGLSYKGHCGGPANGTLSLDVGDNKTCILLNVFGSDKNGGDDGNDGGDGDNGGGDGDNGDGGGDGGNGDNGDGGGDGGNGDNGDGGGDGDNGGGDDGNGGGNDGSGGGGGDGGNGSSGVVGSSSRAPQCSDGIDNDGDGLVDEDDPDCHTDGDVTNRRSYDRKLESEGEGDGEVLGEFAGCGTYLDSYLGIGRQNDAGEVRKLQLFLNEFEGENLPLTGFFGPLTDAAVRRFQLKYSDQILAPWVPYGLESAQTATGYVYKTTQRWINMLHCPQLALAQPELP